jgi:uncharacterized iron-regulated protein
MKPLSPAVAAALLLTASAADLLPTAPAAAQSPGFERQIYDTAGGVFITPAQLLERLEGFEVVYVGETHTDFAHHQVQLAVLEGLRAANPSLVMGWEMFHSSQQPLLDAWSWGRLTEVEWLDAIYWEQTWGHPYPQYRPLLEYARAHQVRIIGLNAPREVIRAVRTAGDSAMTEEQRWWLPAGFFQRIDIPEESDYKAWFMETARHMPNADPAFMEGMFASQTAWNEIMGWNVVKAFNIIPDPRLQVLVIVGSGHAVLRAGIPTRVARFRPGTRQAVVMPQTGERVMTRDEILQAGLEREGDFLWFVPPAQPPSGSPSAGFPPAGGAPGGNP